VELHSWFVRLFWSSQYSRTIIVAVCRRSFFHVVRFFPLSRTLKLISSAWESLVDWVFIRAAYRLMTTNSGFLAWKRYVCDEWVVLRVAIWLSQISCQLCRLRNRLAGSPVCQARRQLLCLSLSHLMILSATSLPECAPAATSFQLCSSTLEFKARVYNSVTYLRCSWGLLRHIRGQGSLNRDDTVTNSRGRILFCEVDSRSEWRKSHFYETKMFIMVLPKANHWFQSRVILYFQIVLFVVYLTTLVMWFWLYGVEWGDYKSMMNWKEAGLLLRHSPRWTEGNHVKPQDNRSPVRDLNPGPPPPPPNTKQDY
jgi:hypothetical protein